MIFFQVFFVHKQRNVNPNCTNIKFTLKIQIFGCSCHYFQKWFKFVFIGFKQVEFSGNFKQWWKIAFFVFEQFKLSCS